MKGSVGKVIAATAAASLVCEVPLPALAQEYISADRADSMTPEEIALESALRDLPQTFVHEGFLPEAADAHAQAYRRPEREYPL